MEKMYWKDGFYDYPIDGAVEISYELYQTLLNEQSIGASILTNDSGMPYVQHYVKTVADHINSKLIELDKFDKSSSINEFYLGFNGQLDTNEEQIYHSMWFDKNTRVGLRANIDDCVRLGRDVVKWQVNGTTIELPVNRASDILTQIETVYALECYITTDTHKANIKNLNTIENVLAYDFTVGYPDKLIFTIYGCYVADS